MKITSLVLPVLCGLAGGAIGAFVVSAMAQPVEVVDPVTGEMFMMKPGTAGFADWAYPNYNSSTAHVPKSQYDPFATGAETLIYID